jgi:hypothetical protein
LHGFKLVRGANWRRLSLRAIYPPRYRFLGHIDNGTLAVNIGCGLFRAQSPIDETSCHHNATAVLGGVVGVIVTIALGKHDERWGRK